MHKLEHACMENKLRPYVRRRSILSLLLNSPFVGRMSKREWTIGGYVIRRISERGGISLYLIGLSSS